MHEQSRTVGRFHPPLKDDVGPYRNVNGVTGKTLIKRFPFEQSAYATVGAAVLAARRRSGLIGKLGEDWQGVTVLEESALRMKRKR